MASHQKVRVGIVGCGDVSRSYFALLSRLSAQGVAELTAACDVRPERRDFVKYEWGLDDFTTDYRDLVQRDTVDLALVLTSMPQHGAVAQAALEAGKHVLVEKPMAATLPEAAKLVETARSSPGFLLPAPHVVLSPTYQAMAARLRAGEIGRVLTARARYGHGGPDWGPWFYRKGGGVLFDLAVYNFTTLTGWLGPAKRVTALCGVAIPERIIEGERVQVEAEDNAHVLLDFGESVFAAVTSGFTMQNYRGPAIELYGTEGTLHMLGDDWAPRGHEFWTRQKPTWQEFPETAPDWPWTDGLRHMVVCIRAGKRPIITPEHAYHVLEIMIRAQESSADGQRKSLESAFSMPDA